MKNKLILFDWGNIVESHTTGYSCANAWKDLFKACGYKGDLVIYNNLSKYKFSRQKNINELEEAYKKLATDYDFNTTFEEYSRLYKEIFSKIDSYQDVADYEKSLKDKCYIGIFSNLCIFDEERIDKQLDLSKYDYVFLSFKMGLRKPEKEIYEMVQKELPFEPQNILFIDDKKDNIDGAFKIGWNTFQATGLELDKIKQKCEEFLKGN